MLYLPIHYDFFIKISLRYFSFLLLLFFINTGTAQNQTKIDSLENLLQTDIEDTTRVNTLNALGQELMYQNTDTSIFIIRYALELAVKNEDKKGQANAFRCLGVCNGIKGNYLNTLDNFHKAIKIYKELNDRKGISASLGNIGIVYRKQGDYLKALKYYFKALEIAEELGNKNTIAIMLGNIGNVYFSQGDYPKALEYHFKALEIAEEIGDKNGIARHLGNIGNVYKDNRDYPKALEYYFKALKKAVEMEYKALQANTLNNIGVVYKEQVDYPKALEYHFKGLEIAEEIGYKNGIAIHLNNIGVVYKEQVDYPNALEYYFKALVITEEIEDKNGIANHLGNIGSLYIEQKKYSEAERYLMQALEIADSIGALNLVMVWNQNLSKLYEQTGRPTKALEHYKLYTQAKDSLFNEEKSKEIGKLEAGYEYEKQMLVQEKEHEKQQALSEAELKRQRIIGYAFIGGFGLVLVLAFVIYRSYRQKKKANQLLEEKNEIIEEKNKDITDSIRYAQNIQEAILPKEAEISKSLPNHFIYFQPRDIVSGDFYWFTRKNGKVFVAACDCTGHGVPGAFVSMIGNDLLNQIIIEKGIENPGEILTNLNNGVKSVFTREDSEQQAEDGMDMALCVFDNDLKTLEFAGAKNTLLVIQNGELIQIKGDINPIGGVTEKNYQFTNHEIDIQNGNTIYMASDGYQDQFGGPAGKKFMIKRFKEKLLSIQDKDMKEQKEILHQSITDWKGDQPQVDDICVIGIRV
ncbi:MAG: tetratricopeptide repeat protein [Bacteroidota bacterium]